MSIKRDVETPRLRDVVATISVLSVTEQTACRAFADCVCVEKLTGDRGVEICLSGAFALSATGRPASSLTTYNLVRSSNHHIFLSSHHRIRKSQRHNHT